MLLNWTIWAPTVQDIVSSLGCSLPSPRNTQWIFLASGNGDDLRVFVPRELVLDAGTGALQARTRFHSTSAPFPTPPPQWVPRLPSYLKPYMWKGQEWREAGESERQQIVETTDCLFSASFLWSLILLLSYEAAAQSVSQMENFSFNIYKPKNLNSSWFTKKLQVTPLMSPLLSSQG